MLKIVSLDLANRFNVCKWQLKHFLRQVKEMEKNKFYNENDRISKIKIINEEIVKVGMEIDNIKKEIIMLGSQHIN